MLGCLFQTVKGGTVTSSPPGDSKLRSEETARFLLSFLGWLWTETPFSSNSHASSLVDPSCPLWILRVVLPKRLIVRWDLRCYDSRWDLRCHRCRWDLSCYGNGWELRCHGVHWRTFPSDFSAAVLSLAEVPTHLRGWLFLSPRCKENKRCLLIFLPLK